MSLLSETISFAERPFKTQAGSHWREALRMRGYI